jgi:hypothetical protein
MIAIELAERLRDAGLVWEPEAGDRFVVPHREMDQDVFVVSDMVVEVHETPRGQILGFNGTTEWALDSVERQAVLWLPRESQLREVLGERFLRLESVTGGYAVVFSGPEGEHREADPDPESAYARAVLAVLAG